jgi:hypothetical protein
VTPYALLSSTGLSSPLQWKALTSSDFPAPTIPVMARCVMHLHLQFMFFRCGLDNGPNPHFPLPLCFPHPLFGEFHLLPHLLSGLPQFSSAYITCSASLSSSLYYFASLLHSVSFCAILSLVDDEAQAGEGVLLLLISGCSWLDHPLY